MVSYIMIDGTRIDCDVKAAFGFYDMLKRRIDALSESSEVPSDTVTLVSENAEGGAAVTLVRVTARSSLTVHLATIDDNPAIEEMFRADQADFIKEWLPKLPRGRGNDDGDIAVS